MRGLPIMKTTSLTVLVALAAVLPTVGCSSKNYVKQQTTPLINKTNELDDMTAKNTHDIKDVDARAQAGIQAVQSKAADVDTKALVAGKQADDVQLLTNNSTKRIETPHQPIVNFANYRIVN